MRRRWLLLLLIPFFLLGTVVFLSSQEWALEWAIGRAVASGDARVEVRHVSGSLAGSMEIGTVVIESPEKDIRIEQFKLDWHPVRLLAGQLDVAELSAGLFSINFKASTDEPLSLPASLEPPLALAVGDMHADTLQIAKYGVGPTLENVHLTLAADGNSWRVDNLGFDSPFGNAKASLTLGTQRPYAISGTVGADSEEANAHAGLVLSGTLLRLGLSGTLAGYGASGSIDAVVSPFSALPVERLDLKISGLDPSRMDSGWPEALLEARAIVNSDGDSGILGTLQATNAKPGALESGRLPVRELSSKILGRESELSLKDMVLNFGKAGKFTGNGLFSSEKTEISLATSAFDLHEISSHIRETCVAGTIHFLQEDEVQEFLVALGENRIRLDALARREGQNLDLKHFRLEAGKSLMALAGHMALDGNKPFALSGSLEHFSLAAFGRFPETDLNARLDLEGALSPEWHVKLDYAFLPSRIFGQALSGEGSLDVSAGEIANAKVNLAIGANSLSATGSLGHPSSRLDFRLAAPQLGIFGRGYRGSLAASGVLKGSFDDLAVNMNLDGSDVLLMDEYGARKIRAEAQLALGGSGPLMLHASLDGVSASGTAWNFIRADVDGTMASHRIDASAKNGRFDLAMAASGSLSKDMVWSGKLLKLENRGKEAFVLDAPAPVRLGPDELAVRDMTISLPEGRIAIEKLLRQGGLVQTSGKASGVPLSYLLSLSQQTSQMASSTVTVGASWDLSAGSSIKGRAGIYREQGDVTLTGDTQVALGISRATVDAVFSGNSVAVNLEMDSAVAGRISMQAKAAMKKKDGSWGITRDSALGLGISANMPSISWIAPLTGQSDVELGGSLSAQISGSGTVGNPRLSGNIDGKNLSFHMLDMGVNLSNGELSARLDGNRLQIVKGVMHGPEGQLTLTGGINMKNGQLASDMAFQAEKLKILSNVDRQLTITGRGHFALDENRLQLAGDWHVNRASIILTDTGNVTYSKDVVVLGRVPRKQTNTVPVSFDMKVDLGKRFHLAGKGIDTYLTGEIRAASSPDGQLRLYGTVNTKEGSYTAYGQKLTLKKGQVTFAGPVESPAVDILAVREFPQSDDVQQVGVSIKGQANAPRIKLVSTPEVSTTEKLSWLVLGYSGGENGDEQQRALVATAAAALLSTQHTGSLPSRIASTIGLDNIGVSSSSQLDDTVLTLTKRISSRLYLSYEQGLTGATNLIKLRYLISRRLSLVGQTGTITAVDLLYDWRFD